MPPIDRPRADRRSGIAGARVSAAQVAGLPEPIDRLHQRFAHRARRIAELAPRLAVVEVHDVTRHAQSIDGGERLAAGYARELFGHEGKRIDRRPRQLNARWGAAGGLGHWGGHVAAAEII